MALEFILMLKLKLKLLAAGSHSHLHVALLWFFLLKLPLATRMRSGSYADMAHALRLFFFRLHRVLLSDAPARNGRQRWERAVRLVRERVAHEETNEDSIHALSMIPM